MKELKTQFFNYLGAQQYAYEEAARQMTRYADIAADIMEQTVNENMDMLRDQYAQADAFYAPYDAAGQYALQWMQQNLSDTTDLDNLRNFSADELKNYQLKPLNDLLGLNGDDALAAMSEQVLQGADVQQAIQLGIDAMTRSAMSGSHGIRSGRLAQELQQFGQSTAFGALNDRRAQLAQLAEREQNQISQGLGLELNALISALEGSNAQKNQYLGMAQLGQQSAAGRAGLGAQLGESLSGQNLIGGQARANSALLKGNAWANYHTATASIEGMRAASESGRSSPGSMLYWMLSGPPVPGSPGGIGGLGPSFSGGMASGGIT